MILLSVDRLGDLVTCAEGDSSFTISTPTITSSSSFPFPSDPRLHLSPSSTHKYSIITREYIHVTYVYNTYIVVYVYPLNVAVPFQQQYPNRNDDHKKILVERIIL
jgi:hypothetical protein